MAIKLKAQSDLGNILSISLSASTTDAPAQLTVKYLTNGDSLPALGTNVSSFVFGSLTFNGVLVSQASHREQGSNYLIREWMDNSVELDQNCIVLYRAGLSTPSSNISTRTFSIPTINITRNSDGNYNYGFTNTSWTSSTSRLSSAGGSILGQESYSASSCTRSEVTYEPNAALNLIGAPQVSQGTFRVSYEGTYRSVLSSIYGDYGCTYWWNWTNDTIQKIDISSGPVGSITDWGFSNTSALDNNCKIFSYEIGATRIGVTTRSNWHVYRNTWDYPEEDNRSSSNANFRQFVNSYNTGRTTTTTSSSSSNSQAEDTVTYTLPPYTFVESTSTIKAYSSFTVSPIRGAGWPSQMTSAYSHIEGLRLYDALKTGTLSIAGYGVIGGYQLPPSTVFDNPRVALWLIEQGFDRGLPFLPQIYSYLGIDSSYTILLAFELDGAANGTGQYELHYPYTQVSYSTGTSDKWFFRSKTVTYTPSATARGFDPCEAGYSGTGGQFGLWRNPSDYVIGDTTSSYFGDATSGCLIQIQQVDMLVDLWRLGIEFGGATFSPGGANSSNRSGGGVASTTGGVTSFYRNLQISNPEALAYWLENGLVIIAVKNVNYTINSNISTAINCGDLSDLAGYVNPNQRAVETPNNVPAVVEFTPNTGTFTVPASWAGGSTQQDAFNPSYGAPNSYNNNSTPIGSGSTNTDPCDDNSDGGTGNEDPETPSAPPPSNTDPAIVPEQETFNITISQNTTDGTPVEPGLMSASGTSLTFGPVTIVLPSLASYRISVETDIEEISREETGTQYEFEYEEPEEVPETNIPNINTPSNTSVQNNTYNRATESNTWSQAGGLSNNAGLQHAVVITDVTDFSLNAGTPSALTSPSSWLQTASAETDGFYFPVSAGLSSLSAQFSSDGALNVQYSYKQLAQRTVLERPANLMTSSSLTNIYS
jgi:hypothetical protein